MLYFSRCRGTVAHLCVIHHNTIHLLERSPRTLPYLPLHGTTHASARSSSAAKLNKMAQGALNPRIAEPCGTPREFDGGTERSAACFEVSLEAAQKPGVVRDRVTIREVRKSMGSPQDDFPPRSSNARHASMPSNCRVHSASNTASLSSQSANLRRRYSACS